ncbi:unnamed protein product [Pleuronectes platessa]|uniref:N-alpha-acetyltransferase 60 n=1 Tax=Pleuronectes platessa TaxID=8262 RepID=A0A9N7Y6G7_PLEPL|nr:unnamed protein product [Pleuronectes platessa]
MSDVVPPTALSDVQLRFLCHDDIENVKLLCGDWFPIEYPDSWYQDITSNKKFFSLAATFRGGIVGMIVAEIKSRTKVHKEDGDILASSFPVDTQVAYILSLGVVKDFRKHGIGSLLLDSLKEHISTTAQDHCKAIYLHVLTTNNAAIKFYENRDFRQHHYLPYYYSIRGVLKDGFTYVLYINGAHWLDPGQPEPLLHPTEVVPTGPVPAPLTAALVQHRLQDWDPVQQNNVTQPGVQVLHQSSPVQIKMYTTRSHSGSSLSPHTLQDSGSACARPVMYQSISPDSVPVWHFSLKSLLCGLTVSKVSSSDPSYSCGLWKHGV